MDRLPDELVLNIFKHSEAEDVGSLRLTAHRYSRIGLGVQFQELHFLMNCHSLRRMEDLGIQANYDLTASTRSLYIETDQLDPQFNRTNPFGFRQWQLTIDLRERPQPPSFPNPTDEQKGNYLRLLTQYDQTPRHTHDNSALLRAWDRYQEIQWDKFAGAGLLPLHYIRLLPFSTIFARLRRIKTLTIDVNSRFRQQSSASHAFFDPALSPRAPISVWSYWLLCQVLCVQHQAMIVSLERLYVAQDYWRKLDFLEISKNLVYLESLQRLLCLHLYIQIMPSSLHVLDGVQADVAECYQYLQGLHLQRLLKASPRLREIKIVFLIPFGIAGLPLPTDRGIDCSAARFQDIIAKDATYQDLELLSLEGVECTEQEFVSFVRRHMKTLTHLELRDICLSKGTWMSLFSKLRDIITLTDFKVGGYLHQREEKLTYSLINETNDIFDQTAWVRARKLEDWVCKRGDYARHNISLEDRIAWQNIQYGGPAPVRRQDVEAWIAIMRRS